MEMYQPINAFVQTTTPLHSHLFSLFALTTPARSVGPTSETSPESQLSSTSLLYILTSHQLTLGLMQWSSNLFSHVFSHYSIKPIQLNQRNFPTTKGADQVTVLLHTL